MTTKNKPLPPPQNIKLPLKVIREEGQVCPDGVVIKINWNDFVVGASLFIPAINLTELNKRNKIIIIIKATSRSSPSERPRPTFYLGNSSAAGSPLQLAPRNATG